VIGGTSVASPIVAATFALAGGAGGVDYPAQTLYAHRGTAGLFDVTSGGNGRCDALYSEGCSGSMSPLSAFAPFDCGQGVGICNAAAGYDGPTGVGTPNGIAAFGASGGEGEQHTEGPSEGGESEETASESEGPGGEGSKESEQPAQGTGSQGAGTTAPPAGSGTGAGQTLPGGGPGGNEAEEESGPLGKTATSAVRLSALALTPRARAAIAVHRRTISEVALTFRLSAAARMRVTLAQRLLVGGRWRWVTRRGGFTVAARRGRGRVRLRGNTTLPRGRYRVTLAPVHGAARSLTFVLG
jgi:hypothetical protein